MAMSFNLIVVCIVIAFVWILIEVKRLKHKLFAIFLIGLILFSYFSFSAIFNESDINFKSTDGLMQAGKIYFYWMYSVFGNFKTITTNAIKMNWKSNVSISS